LVYSMTGYGRAEENGDNYSVRVELKSVNHRFADVSVKMPKEYYSLEERIRKNIVSRVSRGRVDAYLSVERTGQGEKNLRVDRDLAFAYYSSLEGLKAELNLGGQVDINQLAMMPEIFSLEEEQADIEEVWVLMEKALLGALESLLSMRRQEGETLVKDLLKRAELIREYTQEIEERAPLVVEEYRFKLRERLNELLRDSEATVDEVRLASEIAIYADRSSITEEIVRLYSHLDFLAETLAEDGPVGRKLEFILQEINREANTIGSKAQDASMGQKVVSIKSELEKIREQSQNIE